MAVPAVLVCLIPLHLGIRHIATRAAKPPPVYVVLIVLDGARPDYFNVPNLPHITALRKAGTWYSSAWAGILESITPAAHATIGTGSAPNRTGILGFGWPSGAKPWVQLSLEDAVRGGLIDRLLRQAKVPTIAGKMHQHDPSATVVGLGGYKFYANEGMAGPDADVVMYYADTKSGRFAPRAMPGRGPPSGVLSAPGVIGNTIWARQPLGVGDHLAMGLARTTFRRMHQRVTLVNLPEFDMPLGHVLGASRDRTAVTKLMRGFDTDLGALEAEYKRAGVLRNTLFIITADHGFAPLSGMIKENAIRDAVRTTGTDVIHGVYETGAYLWLGNPSRALRVGEAVTRAFGKEVQSVYVKSPGAKHYARVSPTSRFLVHGVDAANRYLLHSFISPHSPDVVIFFDEGISGNTRLSSHWKGDHGGADWESQHIPLLISGPGVRAGYTSTFPARLIDIAPTLLSLSGASYTGMQGIPLADAMRTPSSGTAEHQRAEVAMLRPLIRAMRAEAKRERQAVSTQ